MIADFASPEASIDAASVYSIILRSSQILRSLQSAETESRQRLSNNAGIKIRILNQKSGNLK